MTSAKHKDHFLRNQIVITVKEANHPAVRKGPEKKYKKGNY